MGPSVPLALGLKSLLPPQSNDRQERKVAGCPRGAKRGSCGPILFALELVVPGLWSSELSGGMRGDPAGQWSLALLSSRVYGAFPCSVVKTEYKRNEVIALVTELLNCA